jgi:hypothetical protein
MEQVASLPTLEELRSHVHRVLCSADRLDPEQTPLTDSLVTRAGRTCGLFFQIQGPRSVRAYAIWAGEEGRILYYNSQGTRFAQTRLTEGPDPRQLSAPPTTHRVRSAAA